MPKSILAACALLLAAAPAFAAPAAKPAAPKAAAALVCPVTHETIASAKDAYAKEVYKGKTYYFCCPDCKPTFDKNPAKYTQSASAGSKKAAAKM